MIIETLNSLSNPIGVSEWQERFNDFYKLLGANINNKITEAFKKDLYGAKSECSYNKGNDYFYLFLYFSIMYEEQVEGIQRGDAVLSLNELKEEYQLDCLFKYFLCMNNGMTESKWNELIENFRYDYCPYCTENISVDTTSFTLPYGDPQTVTFNLTAPSNCEWTISWYPGYIGSGSAPFTFNYQPNETEQDLVWTYIITDSCGETITIIVTQKAEFNDCTISINPGREVINYEEQCVEFTVITSTEDCNWEVVQTEGVDVNSITPSSGTGTTLVTICVPEAGINPISFEFDIIGSNNTVIFYLEQSGSEG